MLAQIEAVATELNAPAAEVRQRVFHALANEFERFERSRLTFDVYVRLVAVREANKIKRERLAAVLAKYGRKEKAPVTRYVQGT